MVVVRGSMMIHDYVDVLMRNLSWCIFDSRVRADEAFETSCVGTAVLPGYSAVARCHGSYLIDSLMDSHSHRALKSFKL